jgi:hypothetical protein
VKRYRPYFNEDITIPLNKGDSFLWGKWKNKSAIFDHLEKDEKGQDIIVTDTGKIIPLLKIRLIQESEKDILPIKKNDIRDAYKFLSDYSNLPESVFLDSVKKGTYSRLKIEDLLKKSNTPWDNKRRPKADSRINNTIILAHIKSNIGKVTPDYYLIVDGNHRVIQHIKLDIPFINCFIIECPYLFLNKRKTVTYDKDALQENLRIVDLQKHAGTSDFTKDWVEIRRKILGTGAKTVKLKSMKVNRKKDYITFLFKSFPTYDKIVKAVDFPDTNKDKSVKMYTQQIMILDFFKLAETKPGYNEKELSRKEIKEILNVADVKVSCDCKSFQFQGMNHILTTFDASIYPELRPPKVWNKWHKDDSFTCKHLDMLLTQGLNIYLNNMTSMVNKYLKGNK